MKPKLWSYALEDEIEGRVDGFDFIFWGLAQQNVREAVWIEENVELDEALTRYAMLILGDAWEPIKKQD